MTETQSNTKPLSPSATTVQRRRSVGIVGLVFVQSNTPRRQGGTSTPFDARPDLEQLAREQGAPLAANFDNLLGDFWPDEESVDDFLAARERWRREAREPDS
jgi:hypothetical protein